MLFNELDLHSTADRAQALKRPNLQTFPMLMRSCRRTVGFYSCPDCLLYTVIEGTPIITINQSQSRFTVKSETYWLLSRNAADETTTTNKA